MPATAESLLLPLLLLVFLLACMVVVLVFRVRGLQAQIRAAVGDPSVLARLAAVERDLSGASSRLEHLGGRVERLSDQVGRCLQRVGVVRYDAFKELGGQLSFSVALLDGKQDGVVLSVLNDRDGARAYAKPVAGGRSTFPLSEEEQRAIAQS